MLGKSLQLQIFYGFVESSTFFHSNMTQVIFNINIKKKKEKEIF